ncbi:hypothetical protein Q1695_008089 [Nippostrongylus brasiliensis]|nr:hypothetical protein Q1695_008089 [Nippostrongylus brasiliensis]
MQRRRKVNDDNGGEKEDEIPLESAERQNFDESGEKAAGLVSPIVIGVVLRALCFVYVRPFLLKRPELTSPLVSFRRLQDGIAMYRDGISPYEGDLFHFQPLVLRLLSLANPSELVVFVVFVLMDLVTSVLLSIGAHRYAIETGSIDPGRISTTVLKCYFLNPITIASSAVLSLSVVHNFITAAIVYFFSLGFILPCVALLSLSASLSMYPLILLGSVLLRFPSLKERLVAVGGLALGCGALLLCNWLVNGMNWNFVEDTYGFILRVEDLSPNVGLVWYFFTQVFEHFRAFYLMVFQINLLVYVLPLVLSLRRDAHLHLVISLLLVAVFSSYPTLNDSSIYIALLPMLEKYKKYPRYTLVVAGTIVTCVVLMPVMWHMWIVVGSGNANFYFAVTLIYNVAQIYLMIDLMFAYFRRASDEVSASLVTSKTNFVLH